MDATPGPVPVALTNVTAADPLHRTPRRKLRMSTWSRGLLVGLVFALGLLQGSRAALGDIPLGGDPEEPAAEAPATGSVEPDALRGHFFRPLGSTAVRPPLHLRARTWKPAEPPRLAYSCPAAGC
jgi:hypothetical protein